MFDNARLLDQIERAIDSDPFCPACSAPNTVIEADDSLWIVCSATIEPDGLLHRLSAAMLPHRRRIVVNLVDLAA
jgi:hypothetical protein